MKRISPYFALFLFIGVVVVLGILTIAGGRVSQVFSTINYSCCPTGGGGHIPPVSPPRRSGTPSAPIAAPTAAPAQPRPAGYTPKQNHQQPAIKAGEIDDNDHLQDYLRYLEKYQG